MTKKVFLTLFFTLLTLQLSFGQKENLSSLLISSDLKENANAVVRNQSIEITIDAVDKMVVSEKKVITILNKLGNAKASIGEAYDNNTKITSLSATIYDALGKEVKKYKERDFLDVSAVDGGTLYSDSRIKYLRFTPISYPYTIVYKSEYKTTSTGFIPWWFPINGYHISVENASYVVKNPKGIPYRQNEINFKDFAIENSKTPTEISYSIKNQKAYKYENSTIAYRDFLPKVIVSLSSFNLDGVYGEFTNWQEFGVWMHAKLIAGRDVLDEAAKTKIKELVKGVDDPLEKTKIVYKFMQNKTRYISVQVGIGGWQPIAANEVDNVGYGDCKGLTNYTKALLDVVGVKSYFTLVYGDEKRNIETDFSSFQGNHAILNIPKSELSTEDDLWLECTSQTTPFGFLGDFTDDRDVLVIKPDGGVIKRTTSYKNESNLQTTKGAIKLDTLGNLSATFTRISKGLQYDDKYGYDGYTEEELIKSYKASDWSYNNNLEIDEVLLTNDKENIVFTEEIKASIKNYASINPQEYLFRVNVFNKNSFVPKRYRTRHLPLKIHRGYKDVDEFEFKIPKGYKLEVLPSDKELTTKFGTYTITFKKIDDVTFSYRKVLAIKEGVYPKEDYKKYRSFRRSVSKYENLRIAILKK